MFNPTLTEYRLLHYNDYTEDVKVWRGEGGGLSDHFLVEARLKLLGGWRSAGRMECEKCVEGE